MQVNLLPTKMRLFKLLSDGTQEINSVGSTPSTVSEVWTLRQANAKFWLAAAWLGAAANPSLPDVAIVGAIGTAVRNLHGPRSRKYSVNVLTLIMRVCFSEQNEFNCFRKGIQTLQKLSTYQRQQLFTANILCGMFDSSWTGTLWNSITVTLCGTIEEFLSVWEWLHEMLWSGTTISWRLTKRVDLLLEVHHLFSSKKQSTLGHL